jgi:hypothetical protein
MSNTLTRTIKQGASESFSLVLTDSTATAINLTGCTFSAQIKRAAGYSVLASYTATITSAALGKVSFAMTPAVTASIPVPFPSDNNHVFDVIMTKSDGSKYSLIEGTAIITPKISA